MMARLSHPYMLLTLTVLFWAINSVVGRAVADLVPPVTLNWLRWLIALGLLLPFTWKDLYACLPVIRRNLGYLTLVSVLSITAFNALLYWGLNYTTVINATLMQSSGPVITALLAILILRTRMGWIQAVGILLSVTGVVTIVTEGFPHHILALDFNPGDIIIVGAVSFWGLYSVLLRRKPPELNATTFITVQVCIGMVFLTPMAAGEYLLSGRTIIWQAETFYALAYVSIFPSILAILFWNKGVAEVGPAAAGMFLYLVPVFGILLGTILLSEKLYLFHAWGIGLIFAGVWLATHKKAA